LLYSPGIDAMINLHRRSRRGRKPLPANEKRIHTVSVRLSRMELERLDGKRGRFRRGEWLRTAALDRLPAAIPPMNAKMYQELNRLAVDIDRMSKAMDPSAPTNLLEIQQRIAELRLALLGVDAAAGADEES
jgi:hypothetical protein